MDSPPNHATTQALEGPVSTTLADDTFQKTCNSTKTCTDTANDLMTRLQDLYGNCTVISVAAPKSTTDGTINELGGFTIECPAPDSRTISMGQYPCFTSCYLDALGKKISDAAPGMRDCLKGVCAAYE